MTKKQILSTVLAGLLSLNTLVGCTDKSNNNSSSSNIESSFEETKTESYQFPKYLVREIIKEENTNIDKPYIIEVNERHYIVQELDNMSYKMVTDTKLSKQIVLDYIKVQPEHVEFEDFKISTLDLSDFYNNKGELLYSIPGGYFTDDQKTAYKVEAIKIIYKDAAVMNKKDGTIVYYAPTGGILSGNKVICKTNTLVEESLAREIVNNYIKNAELNLEEFLKTTYYVSTTVSTKSVENGVTTYRVPEDFILVGTKGYRVEEVNKYCAEKITLENGEEQYIETHGGYLIGKFEIVKTLVKDKDLAREIINNNETGATLNLHK